MRSKKIAFTLAEVLITLTIIGVVASLTIPVLTSKINNTATAVQLKKIYAELQQAFMQVQADNGGSIVPVFQNDSFPNGGANVMNAFLTKLNSIKNCGSGTGCWYDAPLYILNGSTFTSAFDNSYNGIFGKSILTSGIMFNVSVSSTSCTNNRGSGPLSNNVCGLIGVDLNGAKAPNMVGRDYFSFYVTQNGIYPRGSFDDGYNCSTSPGDNTNTWGCTYKVITEGAMNY